MISPGAAVPALGRPGVSPGLGQSSERRDPSVDLVAHYGDRNLPPVRRAPVLEKEDTLPCAELHSSIHNGNSFARPSQHHANVRWHVVGAFRVVFEIISILWDQPIEEFLEITACRWICILHHDKAATSVLCKNRDDATFKSALADDGFDFIGDFVSALAGRGDSEVLGNDRHTLIFARYGRRQMTKQE